MFAKTLLRDAKISTKFNLLLVSVLIFGTVLSGIALATILQQRAQTEVATQATILMQTMNSVRDYTQERVNPLLAKRLETESSFTPEAIPNFSVREVFEKFRSTPQFDQFFYKDASLNPTNRRDLADDFEATLLQRFQNDANLKELSGFHTAFEGKVFYIARPLTITNQNCLQCHSDPKLAPKSQIATYGDKNGFGWKLNQIVAAQIVLVPADAVLAQMYRSLLLMLGVLFGILSLMFLFINFLLKKVIIQRIRRIAKTANAISTGDLNMNFEEPSKDEIGGVAIAINRLRSSLKIAMDLLHSQPPES